MKNRIWIVVANSSHARIFKAENNKTIIEHTTLVHPQSRMKGSEIRSDRPGRSYESANVARHAMEDPTPIREEEAQIFAKQIAEELERAVKHGEITKLYIAAGPSFLGMIRKHLHPPVERMVAGEINKDVSRLTLDEIREHLPVVL